MKAKVIAVNPKKGFVAVETDNGITVFELLGTYDVELNDIISGSLESHGGETFRNETQREDMSVYVQGYTLYPSVCTAINGMIQASIKSL